MVLGARDTDNDALRSALAELTPVRSDYQTAGVLESFNWETVLAGTPAGRWYLVVFRSVHRSDADEQRLTEIDNDAYAEAMAASGGLLVYFRGEPDAAGNCVSFCLWTSRDEARRASALPLHMAAMECVPQMYESYRLEAQHLVWDTGGAALEPLTR